MPHAGLSFRTGEHVSSHAGSRHFVALATSSKVPELTDDDRLLVSALALRGVRAVPAIWDDSGDDWHRYSAVVIRSCWDYHLKYDAFLAWLVRLEAASMRVLNPPPLVRWNSEKTYLRELSGRGIAVVPTRWVEQKESVSLDLLLHETGWNEVVVKPAISASAHETWRSASAPAHEDDERFRAMVSRGRVLVQPYLDVVAAEGEWSLLFYGGEYSHGVLKRPAANDFRVQLEHGGRSEVLEPAPEVIEAARRALVAGEQGRAGSLYARVDGCVIDGAFVLMELELIEPDLFLRSNAAAPDRLASALLDGL
jgi:glutathione synthase/RimK-type ligase-like ATP-grasp enzyme